MSQKKLDEFRAKAKAAHDAIDEYAEDRLSGKEEWFIRDLDGRVRTALEDLLAFGVEKRPLTDEERERFAQMGIPVLGSYQRAISDLQKAALKLLESLPEEARSQSSWTTPMIVASLNREPVGENFIAKVERWPNRSVSDGLANQGRGNQDPSKPLWSQIQEELDPQT